MGCCECCCNAAGGECCGEPGSKTCCKDDRVCCNKVCCQPEHYCCKEAICCPNGQACCGTPEAAECCDEGATCCKGLICCDEGEVCCGTELNPVCCPPGQCCYDGVCEPCDCESDEDCGEDECCLAGICGPCDECEDDDFCGEFECIGIIEWRGVGVTGGVDIGPCCPIPEGWSLVQSPELTIQKNFGRAADCSEALAATQGVAASLTFPCPPLPDPIFCNANAGEVIAISVKCCNGVCQPENIPCDDPP